MEEYEKMEEELCEFKKYVKMTMDLMIDSFKWKKLAEYSDSSEAEQKYKKVSDTLYELFMTEHNKIGEMFRE